MSVKPALEICHINAPTFSDQVRSSIQLLAQIRSDQSCKFVYELLLLLFVAQANIALAHEIGCYLVSYYILEVFFFLKC
jgi:hypothetical protein